MADLAALLADLRDEGDDLDQLVADLPAERWDTATPSPGWTIRHQIAHLTWTDTALLTAITDEAAFAAQVEKLAATLDTAADEAARDGAALPPDVLLTAWRDSRRRVGEALAETPADRKIPWLGPPMRPAGQARGRLMEIWAHGDDVAAALGVERAPTDRLRHVADLGVRTIGWSFLVHGEQPPTEPVRVELVAPDGQLWTWGPEGGANRVTGSALDFCLRVTQRRHREDLALAASGPVADRWLDLAQAFAGPPGGGREPAGRPV